MPISAMATRLRTPQPVAIAPLFILSISGLAYCIAAWVTDQAGQISIDGLVGVLQRSVGLGIVALGQTMVILVGSIDLSVATLVSVAAVMASWWMQGNPHMMLSACALVLALAAVVGSLNGLLVTRLKVNALIATLGTGLILQGILSASFNNFAGSVPAEFQVFAYGTIGKLPFSVLFLFVLTGLGWLALSRTRFGAHVYATGGNLEGARLAGIKTERIIVSAHILCSVGAALTGLYLASRLRSGAPWVGRDGVYDLEIDCRDGHRGHRFGRRQGGRLGDDCGGDAVWLLGCHIYHAGSRRVPEASVARSHRGGRRCRLCLAPRWASGMTVALLLWKSRPIRLLARINPSYLALLALLAAIAIVTPSFLEPAGFMNFLRRGAPLAVAASGQLFVIIVGGFDLSIGSLMTLTVMGSALLINNDPDKTWVVIGLMYGIGLGFGALNGFIVSYLKVPSIIATLGALLYIKGIALAWSGGSPQGYLPDNFRQFGRMVWHQVPGISLLPLAVIILGVVVALLAWLLHFTNLGRLALLVGDNPRAAALAGVPVRRIRILSFVLSALSAVTAGILLGGYSGVSTDAGDGFELQSIAATVLGGARLLGGRGTVPGAVSGAFTLTALFTLLDLLGLPKPLRDAVQGLILIAATAYGIRRQSGAA